MPVRIKGTDLIYFPVPKVACTSIKEALLKHNDLNAWKAFHASNSENPLRLLHEKNDSVPLTLGHRIGMKWKGRWFCVVRDPIARFVSGYRNRILFHNDLAKEALPENLDENPSLVEFVRNLERYCAANMSVWHHFRPQVDFLGHRPNRFKCVFNIRQLSALSDFLRANGVLVEFKRFQEGGGEVDVASLDAESIAKLEAVYRDDYRIWGESFEPRR